MTSVKPFAFVLMPFDKNFDDIYQLGIKAIAEESGVVAERVDEQHFSETILERVYRQIENCDFIIADMTGMNPNVFYEVGYAHAKGKMCALITQEASDIPFDLKHHTHVIYDGSIRDLRAKLLPKVEWLKLETAARKENSITVSSRTNGGFLQKDKYTHTGSFTLEITLRNLSEKRSPEIEVYYIITRRSWRLKLDGLDCPYDDFINERGVEVRKHLAPASIKRLAPSAFAQISPIVEREFWNKWSGQEEKDTYRARGAIRFEIVTSEGTLSEELPIDVLFDEIPF